MEEKIAYHSSDTIQIKTQTCDIPLHQAILLWSNFI